MEVYSVVRNDTCKTCCVENKNQGRETNLRLGNNTAGCRLSGLEDKCWRVRPKALDSSPMGGIVDTYC